MSVLDFLNSVYDRVKLVFEVLWYNVIFLIQDYYARFFDFAYNLYSSLRSYHYTLEQVLIFYQIHISNPAIRFFVTFYNYTDFVIVTAKSVINALYYTWASMLTALAGTTYSRLYYVFTSAWPILSNLLSWSTQTVNYVFGPIKDAVVRFINQYEAHILTYLFFETNILTLVKADIFPRLLGFARDMYDAAKTLLIDNLANILTIIGRIFQILTLTELLLFQRIVSIFTTGYTSLINVLSLAPTLIYFFSLENMARLAFLLNDGLSMLLSFYNHPADTILGFIRNRFLPWFGDLLYDWLLSP